MPPVTPSSCVARARTISRISISTSPLNELVVVTGVSGSGKSSLVFDTLYAEGQRRYVETFSPYARQFLDRMDKPQVDSHLRHPAGDRHRPDEPGAHLALHRRHDDRAQRPSEAAVRARGAAATAALRRAGAARHAREHLRRLRARAQAAGDPRLVLSFPVPVPANFTASEVRELLARQGYTRYLRAQRRHPRRHPHPARRRHAARRRGKRARGAPGTPPQVLEVVQDRLRAGNAERGRVLESLEAALQRRPRPRERLRGR